MSIQAVSWVLKHSEAKLGARLVLIAIANHADAEGRNSFPSIASLASEARLSERQVQRTIRTLERQHELTIIEGKGRHGTHLFLITGMGADMGDNMSPVNMSGGVTNRTVRGDKSGQTNVENVTQTVLEPLREPSKVKSVSAPRMTDAPLGEMLKIWNEECGFSPARKLNPTRSNAMRRRWREDFGRDVEQWRSYCQQISGSAFLAGDNDRGWRADLDWALSPSNLAHVIEDRYVNRAGINGQVAGPTAPPPIPEEIEDLWQSRMEH